MNPAATPTRGSQDRASHKGKVSGGVAEQKGSPQELETESDDRTETEYRRRKRVKRLRIMSPQRSDELETEEDVENEEVGNEEDEEDIVDNEATEPEYNEKSATDSVENGDGRFFDSESEYVEDSDVEAENAVESRSRSRSQTGDEPTSACSVTMKELPGKEEKRKRNTRSGRGTRLRMKYGEGNPCDRCKRYGIVCLSRKSFP
jgi:hypothetical protein